MAWFDRLVPRIPRVALVALLIWGVSASAQTSILELTPSNVPGTTKPTNQTKGIVSFYCYDAFTFLPINCTVTATLGPVDPTFGGHIHPGTSDPGKLQIFIGAPGASDVSITGNTGTTFFGLPVAYIAPEASEQVKLQITWTPPPNYVCPDNNEGTLGTFLHSPCFAVGHFDVDLKGLSELQAGPSDPFVFKPRPSGDFHPNAHSGTPSLQLGITLIGQTYSDATGGRRPRITDISLPLGGLFDICGTYSATDSCAGFPGGGHIEHRNGHDADISSVDDQGQTIDCVLQTTDAMKMAFKIANATFHKCYSDGHYHVRFQ